MNFIKYNTRVVNNNKSVNNKKRYIFLNTHLEILEKNIEKIISI
ncbi:hypothetical protein [Borreliella lusitaniae]|nr:hypothetical protein [Borreliella lusitaniae]WNY67261.1 hypothetical protein QIA40_04590 [Borreliella lusitaniae]